MASYSRGGGTGLSIGTGFQVATRGLTREVSRVQVQATRCVYNGTGFPARVSYQGDESLQPRKQARRRKGVGETEQRQSARLRTLCRLTACPPRPFPGPQSHDQALTHAPVATRPPRGSQAR